MEILKALVFPSCQKSKNAQLLELIYKRQGREIIAFAKKHDLQKGLIERFLVNLKL
ncbi:hypothetical protein HYS11_00710 [Candidatus Gottesmanbacteria bacterium]|nr:hypothetical protein [Candidatus Gottesmanbacteria bacterium]